MKIYLAAAAAFSLIFGSSADASVFRFTAKGVVTRIIAAVNGGQTFEPTGLALGDPFSVSALIDTETAVARPDYDADPRTMVYDHTLRDVALTLNGYRSFGTPDPEQSGVQIWDGYSGSHPDVWYVFSNDMAAVVPVGPFGVGPGAIAQNFYFAFFDFSTLSMINAVNINQVPDLNLANYRAFDFVLSDRSRNGGREMVISGTFTSAAVAAIPEPNSWLTMVLGFGLVGGVLRIRGHYLTTIGRSAT